MGRRHNPGDNSCGSHPVTELARRSSIAYYCCVSTADAGIDSDIDKQLKRCRFAAYHAQQRYGLLVGTMDRLRLLQERFPRKQVYNSVALQPFRDSFDMLVIDLCSAAKAWLDDDRGLFRRLARQPNLLRRRTAEDFGGGDFGEIVAKDVNAAIVKLVPDEEPVGAAGIERLRERFRLATKRVVNDRNKVRAHRYEQIRGAVDARAFQISLEEYATHVEYLVDHILQACLAINGTAFDTEIKVPHADAADLADLIFHGTIGGATWTYRTVCKAASKQDTDRYGELRELALQSLDQNLELYFLAFPGVKAEP